MRNVVDDFTKRVRSWLKKKWHAVYYNYKPHIYSTIHSVETGMANFIGKINSKQCYLLFSIYLLNYLSSIYLKLNLRNVSGLSDEINVLHFKVGNQLVVLIHRYYQ